MTIRQVLAEKGITDMGTLTYMFGDQICDVCNAHIEKNLGPSDPSCDGRWCDQAMDMLLDQEVDSCTSI